MARRKNITEFHKILQQKRQAAGLSTEDMAAKIGDGMTKSTYSNYESQAIEPPYSVLIRIADIFNVSIDDLFDHKTEDLATLKWKETVLLLGKAGFAVTDKGTDSDNVTVVRKLPIESSLSSPQKYIEILTLKKRMLISIVDHAMARASELNASMIYKFIMTAAVGEQYVQKKHNGDVRLSLTSLEPQSISPDYPT